LTIDLARREVRRGSAALDVAGLNFDLLAYLITQGERVVEIDELVARVWAPAIVSDETVTQRVKLLRQALGDDSKRPRYVRSVRGRGYALCAAPRAIVADAPPSPSNAPKRVRIGARVTAALALIVLVVGGTIAWQFWRQIRTAAPVAVPDDAYASLLKRARYYAAIGQKDDNERAIELFERAHGERPGDDAAAVGLAFAYSARVCLYDFEPEWAERAIALTNTVIARAPRDSGAHAAQAYAEDCIGRIDRAIAGYERAAAFAPVERRDSVASVANLYVEKGRLADALRANVAVLADSEKLRFLQIQIARNLALLGFVAPAERRYRRSFELYPDNLFSNVAWPRFLYAQGRLVEAEAALAVALDRPRHPDLLLLAAELAATRGDTAAARASVAQAAAQRRYLGEPATLALVFGARPLNADAVAARTSAIRAEIARGNTWPNNFIELAALAAAQDDPAAALAALDESVVAGFRDRAYLQVTPLFQTLRADPAFLALIQRIDAAVAEERAKVLAADWLPADLLASVFP
jgi:DNA-binding winged helix-turn-helix (wHTH) protein/Tfp pilus assembly protein PilF